MKYYIIAGEASGDLHASNLMKSLKEIDPEAQFRYYGGDLMQAHGGTLVKHYKEMAFMGFVEVLANIRTISKNLNQCKLDLTQNKPDVVILVDYPGFNLRIAKFAFEAGLKVFYYISPKIWAWKQSRVHTIKKYVHQMFTIFPFETDFYAQFDYKVNYIGNPLLDAIEQAKTTLSDSESFRSKYKLDKRPIVAVLPGSRKQELTHHLPRFAEVMPLFPDIQFVIAGISSMPDQMYDSYLHNAPCTRITDATYELLHHSSAAWVASGTATLETALFDVPQVVCDHTNPITFRIAYLLVNVKQISLVNLILKKVAVKELVQWLFTKENLVEETNLLLHNNDYILQMKNEYRILREMLGQKGASDKAAKLMIDYLKSDNK